MGTFLYLLLKSLETGSVYALAALGIVLIFRTSSTTNFAQGSIGTLNAFVAASLLIKWDWSIWVVAIIAMITAFITGIIIDTLIIRPASKVSAVSKQIITLGLIMVIIGLIPMIFGVDPLRMPRFIEITNETTLYFLDTSMTHNAIFVILTSISIMGFLFWFLKYTRWGLAIRVTASNEVTSRLMGVPTKRVTMASWATAAALGTLAALIIAPQSSVNVMMMTDVQVNAFFACVLGGFGTFYGPVLGAYIIAFSKNITQFYIT
ncbi:MAG: branched-chain amino acid ABC transporter permease, partial [Candidatus Izimaplasma sp.]|nr:branched-chain amino acid ABC transporter permease [Candidatus Izimaplasma bacterium]